MENLTDITFGYIARNDETSFLEKMENFTNFTKENFPRNDKIISDSTLSCTKMIFGMVLLVPVSVLGIIGNVISLKVLRHQKGKTATVYCLIGLTLSDLLLLINALLFSGINIYIHESPIKGTNFRNLLFPYVGIYFSLVTARITSLLTALLSIERFVAVYFPMKAKLICNKTTTLIAIITIYLITAILFIPFCFKYKTKDIVKNHISMTILVQNSDFSQTFFQLYGIVMNCTFRFFPIVLIVTLNIAIMYIIRKTRRTRETLSSPNSDSQMNEQRKITRMLLVVSLTFLICILPGAINSLLQTTWEGYSRLGKSRNFQQFLSYITFFLEALNSSVNFIIYMALSIQFRKAYMAIFHSAKTFIREVSIHSMSRERASLLRRKLEYQSSFSYSDERTHQRLTNQQSRKDSYKSLLQHSGNGECSSYDCTDKVCHHSNGTIHELTENNKSRPVLKDNPNEFRESSGTSDSYHTARLAKQDTLETSVDGL